MISYNILFEYLYNKMITLFDLKLSARRGIIIIIIIIIIIKFAPNSPCWIENEIAAVRRAFCDWMMIINMWRALVK